MDNNTLTPTVGAVLEILRDELSGLREDNRQQHSEIMQRLTQINGRVQRHDREIAEALTALAAVDDIDKTVHEIENNYITKTQLWTGTTTLVGAVGFALFWILERLWPR